MNSKLSNLILYLELGTKVKNDNQFFGSINKQLLKISSGLKSIES
jgi:hypothetical protein